MRNYLSIDLNKKSYLKPLFVIGFIGVIGLALFPYGALTQKSDVFEFIVYGVFGSELSHILGHFVLFGMIGAAVLIIFPKLLRMPILYLSLILNLAGLQEVLQLVTFKRRPINMGEVKDLGIDLTAAVFVFLLIYLLFNLRQQPQ